MLTLRRSVVGMLAVLLVSGVAGAQTPADIEALRVKANAGDADAQRDLGPMYYLGEVVPLGNRQAISWFRKAAKQGDADAQWSLGHAYYNGQGVSQDYVETYKWLNLAASGASAENQTRYAEFRDARAKEMTPAQIAEAQKLAREWRSAFDARQE
jgi:TPR repeat protein